MMSEYHVSCGMFGIYAGTVKKNGTEWKDKTRVTDDRMNLNSMKGGVA